MGLEEALILLYLLVDDAYRIVTFGGRVRQRGPDPKLCDVEVLTMEIFGEQQGRHNDAAIHRYFAGHWRHFFPDLGSYPAFARQCAALSLIKQRILGLVFPASDTHHLVDGFSPCRRLSDPGLSRLSGQPMPDLPGRGRVGLLRDQEGAFLRL